MAQEIDEDGIEPVLLVYSVDFSTNRPYTVELQVEGKPPKMEIDMGASVLLMSEETFCRVLPH